jgi:hypothetical protein
MTHNINNYTSAALSLPGLTAGIKNVSVESGAEVAGNYFEILQVSVAPTSRRRIIIC